MKKYYIAFFILMSLITLNHVYGDLLFKKLFFSVEAPDGVNEDALIPTLGSKVQLYPGKTGIVIGYRASGNRVIK